MAKEHYSFGLLDEIGLEGLDGITLEMFWQRLRDRPNFSNPVDEDSKIFFWKTVAMHKDIEIYELPKPRRFYPIYNRYDHIDPELGIVLEPQTSDPDPYAPIVPIKDGDVRGSCSTYEKRKCITNEIRSGNVLLVPLKEAEDRWGDSLVLVGSPKQRLLSLIGTVINPLIDVSLDAYCLLERIGRSRYLGEVSQGEGGLLILKAPFCRQLHYHRKKLTLNGLITKQNHFMKTKKGTTCTGSLFHLIRFYVQRKTKMTIYMQQLCDILNDKPQKQEVYIVLREEMKIPQKTFKKLFYPHFRKWVKEASIPCRDFYPNGTHKDWFTGNGQQKYVRVCQLMKHCEEEDDDDEEADGNGTGVLPANVHFDSSKIYHGIPLIHQLYGHIKDAGPSGVSGVDLGRIMTLPRLDIRWLVKYLLKKGHVISVLQDRGRQKVTQFIANIYANQNPDYSSLKVQDILAKKPLQENKESENHNSSKRKYINVKEIETGNLPIKKARINLETSVPTREAESHNNNPKGSELDSKDQSIASQVEQQNESHFTEMTPTAVGFSVLPPYTVSSQLTSRKLKRSNIILEYLKSERLTTLSDLQKHIMEKEKQEGYSYKVDKKSTARIVYSLYNNKQIKMFKAVTNLKDKKTEIEFICESSFDNSDPLLQAAVESEKFKSYAVSMKANSERPGAKKEICSPSVPKSNAIAAMNKCEANSKKSVKKSTTQLDEVIVKYPPMTPKFSRAKALHSFLFYLVYKHKGNPCNIEKQIVYHDAVNWRRFVPPLLERKRKGWVIFSDIYSRMPLSLFVKIVYFHHGFPDLNTYLENEEKSHYLIKFLPPNLRTSLLNKRKYQFSICELIKTLCYLGLVSKGPAVGQQRDKLYLYVHKHASIKDTTISPPGYVHIKKDMNYEVKSYTFHTEDDVETFWLDLEHIAFHTPLGTFNAAVGKTIRITEADYKPELILATKHKQFTEVVDKGNIPGDGLGAGGFDSSLYLHRRRNWRNSATSQLLRQFQKPSPEKDTGAVSMQTLLKRDGKISTETRTRLQRLTTNTLLKKVDITKSMNKTSDKAKVIESTSEVPKKKQRTKIRTVKRLRTSKRAPYYDEKDKVALSKMDKIRCTWTSEENSFLLLCKVASSFLDPYHCKNLVVPYTVVRDLLYKQVPEVSENKTSRACQRRLRYMTSNAETINNVNVFLGEALQDDKLVKEFNLPKPPKTHLKVWTSRFTAVVTKLLEKFTSSAPERRKNFMLPSSRDELEKNYELISYYKKNHNFKDLYKAPKSVEDIRKFVLSSLILSAMAVTDETEWSYLLYKLYLIFPKSDKSSAISSLREAGILAKRRSDDKIDLKRSVGRYKFSINYKNKMLTKFPVKIFKEAETLFYKLKSLRRGVKEELIGDVPPGVAAAVLSLMQINQLVIETRIPSQIILFDSLKFKEKGSNIVKRKINTSSDEECTEWPKLLNDDTFSTTLPKNKKDPGKVKSTLICPTARDNFSTTDESLEMGNSQMSDLQRSTSRNSLYLLRQHQSEAPVDKLQNFDDYIVLNSCNVYCHLKPVSDVPDLQVIPAEVIESSSDQNELKTNKEVLCITKEKMVLTDDKIVEISQQLIQFIPSDIFLPSQDYLHQIEVVYQNYSSIVLLDARHIFDTIYLYGEIGIAEKDIWKKFPVLSDIITLLEHLVIFRKSGLVIRAGIVEFTYVCGCFAKNYVLPSLNSANLRTKNNRSFPKVRDSGSESSNISVTETLYFIPRTWRNPDGTLNQPTFFSLLSIVLSHIISMPGISSSQVCDRFFDTLPPVQTLELIEILEKASCVYKYYCKPLKKKSLFSSVGTVSVSKIRGPEDVDHIEPFPDALCKIADLRSAIE